MPQSEGPAKPPVESSEESSSDTVSRFPSRGATAADTSMSKALATLVSLGLEGQEVRKREFYRRLRRNLASDNPKQQDRLVDEFRSLILGQ